MKFCKFCRNIDLQAELPPGKYVGKGYKHQPDLVNMVQAAGLGCELCQFFLNCAEGLSQDGFEEVQNGGQLYFGVVGEGTMSIKTYTLCPAPGSESEEERVPSVNGASLCYFDYVTPDLSRSYPLPMQMTAAKIV
jgi:hypothetical protein